LTLTFEFIVFFYLDHYRNKSCTVDSYPVVDDFDLQKVYTTQSLFGTHCVYTHKKIANLS